MSKQTHSIGGDHFSKKIQRALLNKGIVITGITTIPGADKDGKASFLYGTSTGYMLNDNDTGRIASYFQVEAMAGA